LIRSAVFLLLGATLRHFFGWGQKNAAGEGSSLKFLPLFSE